MRLAPANSASDARVSGLARELHALGITRIYSEYWTCNRLTFATGEEVVCAVLGRGLTTGDNRYPAYVNQVGTADAPAYVAPTLNDQWLRDELEAYLDQMHVVTTVTDISGYRIYQTGHRIGIPAQ